MADLHAADPASGQLEEHYEATFTCDPPESHVDLQDMQPQVTLTDPAIAEVRDLAVDAAAKVVTFKVFRLAAGGGLVRADLKVDAAYAAGTVRELTGSTDDLNFLPTPPPPPPEPTGFVVAGSVVSN